MKNNTLLTALEKLPPLRSYGHLLGYWFFLFAFACPLASADMRDDARWVVLFILSGLLMPLIQLQPYPRLLAAFDRVDLPLPVRQAELGQALAVYAMRRAVPHAVVAGGVLAVCSCLAMRPPLQWLLCGLGWAALNIAGVGMCAFLSRMLREPMLVTLATRLVQVWAVTAVSLSVISAARSVTSLFHDSGQSPDVRAFLNLRLVMLLAFMLGTFTWRCCRSAPCPSGVRNRSVSDAVAYRLSTTESRRYGSWLAGQLVATMVPVPLAMGAAILIVAVQGAGAEGLREAWESVPLWFCLLAVVQPFRAAMAAIAALHLDKAGRTPEGLNQSVMTAEEYLDNTARSVSRSVATGLWPALPALLWLSATVPGDGQLVLLLPLSALLTIAASHFGMYLQLRMQEKQYWLLVVLLVGIAVVMVTPGGPWGSCFAALITISGLALALRPGVLEQLGGRGDEIRFLRRT